MPRLEVPLLRTLVTRFADDSSGRTFEGYTDGQLWNGYACPHLALGEVKCALDVLLDDGGDEPHYTVIDDRRIRVHGKAGVADDFVMTAKLAATSGGDLWLFDCGGVWAFVEIPQGELS